ncbi:DUF3592 domain-containing protein [Amycolatopsis sp. NEAU-NG30]|uniref:DUF3592 domain-containing protein n=1 Tax=Amycolatopsis melonis TaxID=3156488 RepID=A0ABV0LR04_9PSEU
MDLGKAVRRLGRRRTAWHCAVALGGAVFLLFAVGTSVTLLDPGYVFDDGELAADLGTLAAAGALVALALARLRVLARRAEALLAQADLGTWLPPQDDHDSGAGAETARLRMLSRRAAVVALFWSGVFAGCVAGINALDGAAARLLATGTHTAGVVEAVHTPRSGHGTPSMQVRYYAAGTTLTAEISRDSDHAYEVGEPVTVVYDPADPGHVRTPEEKNDNPYLMGLFVVPMLLSFGAVPMALVAIRRWGQRYQAVRHTGWRSATVTVVPDYPVRKGRHTPDIHVRFRDGSEIALRASMSTHGATIMKGRPDRPAWVGGWGRDMVVLFPDAPLHRRPYAVPAYARSARQPMSPVR